MIILIILKYLENYFVIMVKYQKYTSEKTDICQISSVFKQNGYPFPRGSLILDYGGGKCNKTIDWMRKKGCRVLVYDPFNRSQKHNDNTMRAFHASNVQFITCTNVLNVIMETEIVANVIKEIAKLAREKQSVVIFTVYERNKSGVGCLTSRGWQRNNKFSWYFDLIKSLNCYKSLTKKRNMIVCVPLEL